MSQTSEKGHQGRERGAECKSLKARKKIGREDINRTDVTFSPDDMSSFSVGGLPIPLPVLPLDRAGKRAREAPETARGSILPPRLGRGSRRRLPPVWTFVHVMDRLEEAVEILGRIPMNLRPREFGNAMPVPTQEAIPLIDSFEMEEGGQMAELHRDRNTVRLPASAAEITRMDQALGWPAEFLMDKPALARAVGRAALWAVLKKDPNKECRRIGVRAQHHHRLHMRGLKLITAGLVARGVPVS
jgi:hypothetical protein